jgi:serine/threonine-protein kinase
MIGSFGEVLVLDWGVAKLTGKPYTDFTNQSVQSVDGFNTNAGTVIGTRDYMSPEQARGEIDQLDERADVYSLGAVLHFLLKDQPKLSKAAQAICLKARADQKENRYSTASELSADIGRLLDAEPVSAYRESAIEKASRWVSKNRFLVLLVLAYVLMRVFLVFTSQP